MDINPANDNANAEVSMPSSVNCGEKSLSISGPVSWLNEHDFRQALDRARKREKLLLQRILKARDKGKRGWMRYHVNRYLTSHSVKLTVLVDRWHHKKRRKKLNWKLLQSLAQHIDMFEKSDRPVSVLVRPKKSGSDYGRAVLSFDLVERTRQEILRRVMTRALPPLPSNQFSSRRGRTKAVRQVQKYLDEGSVYVVTVDIKSCYPSFDRSKLPELFHPIAEKVIREVLVPELGGRLGLNVESPITVSLSDLNAPLEQLEQNAPPVFVQARRGLMQGAVASSLASDFLLSPIMRELLDAPGAIVNYADNFVLIAKTPNEAKFIFETLQGLMKVHPAGPLSLKIDGYAFEKGQSFEFLGYRFLWGLDGYVLHPTNDNREIFTKEAKRRFQRIALSETAGEAKDRIKRLRNYVRNWTSAFSASDEAKQLQSQWNQRLDNASKSLKKTPGFTKAVDHPAKS
jgi:hypothetical protein